MVWNARVRDSLVDRVPHDRASGFFKLAVYRTGEPPPAEDSDEDDDSDDDEDGDDDPDPPGAPTLSGSVTVTSTS